MATQLFIKTPEGKTVLLDCNGSDSVHTIKQKLQSMYGIPLSQQRLLLADKQLVDEQMVSELGTGRTAEVMLRLLGGAGPPSSVTIGSVTNPAGQFSVPVSWGNAAANVTAIAVTVYGPNSTSTVLGTQTTTGLSTQPPYTITIQNNSTAFPYIFTSGATYYFAATATNGAGTSTLGTQSSGFTYSNPAILTYTLTSASTTGFTINITQLDNAAAASDAYWFTMYRNNGSAIGGTDYQFAGAFNPSIGANTVNFATLATMGFTNPPYVAGDYLNVQIQDKTASGVKTYSTNYGSGTAGVQLPGGGGGGVSCFLASSTLLTPSGYKAAKDIKTGDLLVTSDGRKVPVKAYSFTINKTTEETAPFLILKNAFRNGYPKKDLTLSPEHAIMFEKDLWMMPKWLKLLAPEATQQFDVGKSVTYYHFEAPHYFKDNLICDGVIVESFANHQLDDVKVSIWSYTEKQRGYKRLPGKPAAKVILM